MPSPQLHAKRIGAIGFVPCTNSLSVGKTVQTPYSCPIDLRHLGSCIQGILRSITEGRVEELALVKAIADRLARCVRY